MFRQIVPTLLVIIFFFVTLFAYVKLAGPIPFSVNSVSTTKSDTFQVTGEGKVNVAPDVAVVSAGVTSDGATVKASQDQINMVVKKISDAVKTLGIKVEDIQTTNYSINPKYDFQSGSQRVNGYTANTTLTIKVKDLDKINQVIDVSTSNGANQINGLSFDVSDKEKAQNEAREKAVSDAKKKAEQAAKVAGFTLGRLINYQENIGEPPIILQSRGALASDVEEATQVEPGTTEITVSVTLSYEVR